MTTVPLNRPILPATDAQAPPPLAYPVAARVNAWVLTQVAFCAECSDPMYGSTVRYGDKTYAYYCCGHSLRRDGLCIARRVQADELETAIADELLALVGDVELAETKLIAGRNYSEDITRVAEQIGHLFAEIQVEVLTGKDVREKQETLQRAQEELARLHSLTPVQAREEHVSTGQTLRQRWESLDASGRNGFLRENKVRAVVSRNQLAPIEHETGPMTPLDILRTAIIDRPGVYAVVHLGSLGDMMSRASRMASTRP